MSILSRLFLSKPTALFCPHCEKDMAEGHDVDRCARKGMSRRFFFGIVGGAAVAAVIAPKLRVMTDDPGYDVSEVTLRYINPSLRVFADRVDAEFAAKYPKIGEAIFIRNPPRYLVTDGASLFNPAANIHAQYEGMREKLGTALANQGKKFGDDFDLGATRRLLWPS
jgi:hypothetical protein